MKAFLKKYKYWIIGGAFLSLVVIPLLINHLFQQPAPVRLLDAEWYASDAISFYGTILSSIATIAGVYWSIEYAQRNYRTDEINRVKPYFALTYRQEISAADQFFLGQISSNDLIDAYSSERNDGKRETSAFILITDEKVKFKTSLSQNDIDDLKSGGLGWVEFAPGCLMRQPLDYVSLPFQFENVGNGASINTMIIFYKDGTARRGMNCFTLKVGASQYCHVLSGLPSDKLIGKYILELSYEDILGNRYTQKYPIEFLNDTTTNRMIKRIDLSGTQALVKEKENGKNENGVN